MIFRAPATSLECCCFINNDEFLSGSDDGSIEHWNVTRKKPVHIVKNAHASLQSVGIEQSNGALSNGHMGKLSFCVFLLSLSYDRILLVVFSISIFCFNMNSFTKS